MELPSIKKIYEFDDEYELDKMYSMLTSHDEKTKWIKEIISVFDTEIIVRLKDNSCHSIIMKDNIQARELVIFIKQKYFSDEKIKIQKERPNKLLFVY